MFKTLRKTDILFYSLGLGLLLIGFIAVFLSNSSNESAASKKEWTNESIAQYLKGFLSSEHRSTIDGQERYNINQKLQPISIRNDDMTNSWADSDITFQVGDESFGQEEIITNFIHTRMEVYQHVLEGVEVTAIEKGDFDLISVKMPGVSLTAIEADFQETLANLPANNLEALKSELQAYTYDREKRESFSRLYYYFLFYWTYGREKKAVPYTAPISNYFVMQPDQEDYPLETNDFLDFLKQSFVFEPTTRP